MPRDNFDIGINPPMVAHGVTRSVTIGANGYIPVGVRRVRATGTTATGIYTLLP